MGRSKAERVVRVFTTTITELRIWTEWVDSSAKNFDTTLKDNMAERRSIPADVSVALTVPQSEAAARIRGNLDTIRAEMKKIEKEIRRINNHKGIKEEG